MEEAKSSFQDLLNGKFGEASKKVLIEEFLDGIELSVFVITDGQTYKILPEAKDYKRIGEGDSGGLACAPVAVAGRKHGRSSAATGIGSVEFVVETFCRPGRL